MFRRISSLVNPYASRLLDFPGLIFPCFDLTKDLEDFKMMILNEPRNIYVEFGSGSGGHLIEFAKRNTGSLCLGFEIRFKRAVRTIEKAQEQGINNIIIFRGKGELVPDIFKANRISGIFINFPDPWEKKRWLKHRILTSNIISKFSPLLENEGFLSIKTDHKEYFQTFIEDIKNSKILSDMNLQIREEFSNLPRVSTIKDHNLRDSLISNFADIESEFEKLFRSQNKDIGYCRLCKIA